MKLKSKVKSFSFSEQDIDDLLSSVGAYKEELQKTNENLKTVAALKRLEERLWKVVRAKYKYDLVFIDYKFKKD